MGIKHFLKIWLYTALAVAISAGIITGILHLLRVNPILLAIILILVFVTISSIIIYTEK